MKQMARRAVLLLIFVAVFAVGLVIFCIVYAGNAPSWTSYPANRHIFNTNADLSGAGTIYDRSGAALAKTVEGERLYHADAVVRKATLHAVGDLDGYIVTGLHSSYWDKLVGYNLVNGVFQPSGQGQRHHPDAGCQGSASRRWRRWAATAAPWGSTITKPGSCSAW